MPVAVIERNLDAMSAVKLNVFHWHLSDDQGFRVESRRFPKLQGLGSDGNFYTQDQVRHVVSYAADRGIRVVPEFDIPGHITSWAVGYPELASAPGPYEIGRKWGVYDATLDPTRPETYRFLEKFIGEMTALFPDPYFHIGGDEVTPTDWNRNPAIQRFMAAHSLGSPAKLQEYFNRKIEAILVRHGRKMIGWDEILTPDLPRTAIIQSWRGQDSLAAAARGGHRGILSSGYYLDHMRSASYHYANDPLSGDVKALTPEQADLILGGEACMWTEYASQESVDSRIWPRLAAVAERLWSPATVTSIDSMYQRLEAVSIKLELLGLEHRSAQREILERIAGFEDAAALHVMAGAVAAAGIHDRYPAHTYNSLEPLNRFVDAAVAENDTIRHLVADAKAADSDEGSRTRLHVAFRQWQELPGQISPIAARSFLAAETVHVAVLLSRVAETGEQALGYIERAEAPSPAWLDAQHTLLADAAKLTAEARIEAADVLRALLNHFNRFAIPSRKFSATE